MPGNWHTAIINNQSLSGAVNRFFNQGIEWTDTARQKWFDFEAVNPFFPAGTANRGLEFVRKESPLPIPIIRLITVLLYALVVVPSAFAFWLRRRKGPPQWKASDTDALEFSIVLLLMLLLSPNSSPAHFCILILPAFCVARIAVMERNRAAWYLLLAATFFTVISNNYPGLKPLNNLAHWAGAVTTGTLLLIGGLHLGLMRKSGDNPST